MRSSWEGRSLMNPLTETSFLEQKKGWETALLEAVPYDEVIYHLLKMFMDEELSWNLMYMMHRLLRKVVDKMFAIVKDHIQAGMPVFLNLSPEHTRKTFSHFFVIEGSK